jgi:hypothetical protein
MPLKNDDAARALLPAIIVGVSIVLGAWAVRSPLQQTAEELDGIRLALADTKQALQSVAQARPAAPPTRQAGPDPARRYTVRTDGAPAKGPATAKVKIVEFSDFQ